MPPSVQNYLSQYGKVAILDIDYHHGNNQQDIFYKRNDVLTISLHTQPSGLAYPYFTGFTDRDGEGTGYGYNLNMPLPENLEPEEYLKHLNKALKRIREYDPAYSVVALGLDTAEGRPDRNMDTKRGWLWSDWRCDRCVGFTYVSSQEADTASNIVAPMHRNFSLVYTKLLAKKAIQNFLKTHKDRRSSRVSEVLSNLAMWSYP